MAELVTSQGYKYQDLSRLKIVNRNNSEKLSFEFVKAHETFEYNLINSFKSEYTTRNAPDAIHFSPHHHLLKKIPRSNLYQLPTNYSPTSGYYELAALDYGLLFTAIQELQQEGVSIIIPSGKFKVLIDNLLENNIIRKNYAQQLQNDIKTSLIMDEYKKTARKTRDVNRAISLAYFYLTDEFYKQDAIYWLCEAQYYLAPRNISTLLDLDNFLENFSCIESPAVFYRGREEIIHAIAKCNIITSISLCPFTNYTCDITTNIGLLLKLTKSITNVNISATWSTDVYDRLNEDTIGPIIEALKVNYSIVSLNVSDTRLNDKVGEKILQAIKNNPNSKLKHINLFSCGIGGSVKNKIEQALLKE